MKGFLNTNKKQECCGCGACIQICPKGALTMVEDEEGFRYPVIDKDKCINCGLCHKVCQYEKTAEKNKEEQKAFGGYNKDWIVREASTSGGAFSAIVDAYCDKDYVIFGAKAEGLNVYHTCVDDKNKIDIFRKSKYSQSEIGTTYKEVKKYLKDGKKVLFSGTPCQIAGLKQYLMNDKTDKLLTVEVVCEGVPSPHYVRKLDQHLFDKYKSNIDKLDYRYKDSKKKNHGKWDFQVMMIELKNGKKLKKDRWFNPYWNIWLNHLMSRPSCYSCPYATEKRVADITLGDLWGVHLYCPELYGHNGGSSLVVANSSKGKDVLEKAKSYMYGHDLSVSDAIKYQSPMRKCISSNDKREEFMKDVSDSEMTYDKIVKKWYQKPKFKLLWSKYVWGNRQKVFVWNLKHKRRDKNGKYD